MLGLKHYHPFARESGDSQHSDAKDSVDDTFENDELDPREVLELERMKITEAARTDFNKLMLGTGPESEHARQQWAGVL